MNQPTEGGALIGNMRWMVSQTGWTHDKISRLCRQRVIPGAFKALPGRRGDAWSFRKGKTLAWLEGIEAR